MAKPDLSDLEAFAAVADAGGFRGAATARNASASALSEAVRRLEGRIGVRLLNRTTRSVTLTEAGAWLLERLIPALDEVDAALDVVNRFRDTPTGTLRLNVPGVVARVVLAPIATDFLKSHPGVTLEVVVEDSFVDVLAARFDAGVRYGERLEQDMIALPIGPKVQRFAAGAAPAYLAARGRPGHPRDLLDHACIRHRFPSGSMPAWEFERDGEIVRVDPAGQLISTSSELEISAALAGLGVLASFEEFLAPHFASGALEPVLPEWWQSFPGPFLYYAGRRHMPGPLRAFVDFVRARPAAPSPDRAC